MWALVEYYGFLHVNDLFVITIRTVRAVRNQRHLRRSTIEQHLRILSGYKSLSLKLCALFLRQYPQKGTSYASKNQSRSKYCCVL